MLRLPLLVLALWALFHSTFAWSDEVAADFFDVEVEVEDQSAGERRKGFSAAIEILLQKLSGVPVEDIRSDSGWSQVTGSPGRYIERYTYRAKDDDDNGDDEAFVLRVQFSARPLQEWLMAQGLPLWPPQRPKTVLWLAVDDGGRRLLHGDDLDSETARQVIERARQWGVPLRWPDAGDVGHRDGVAASDVTGGFDRPLLDTAASYGDGPVVAVALSRRSGQWHWQWRWLNGAGDNTPEGSQSAAERERAIADGFDDFARTLARSQSLVVSGEALKHQEMDVSGIDRLEELAALRDMLDSWVMVKSVTERRIEGDRVVLDIALHGTRADLLKRLRQSGRLELLDDNQSPAVSIAPRLSPEAGEETAEPVTIEQSGEADELLGPIRLRWLGSE